jgi:hypothetical protein
MSKFAICAAFLVLTLASAAQAADCGGEFDALAKAVSGHLTMAPEKKVSMMRMATKGYDHCMAGNTKDSGNIRDVIMMQIKESLGAH